ncbi:hypothetical protein D3C72_2590660 [compost metagenome]
MVATLPSASVIWLMELPRSLAVNTVPDGAASTEVAASEKASSSEAEISLRIR